MTILGEEKQMMRKKKSRMNSKFLAWQLGTGWGLFKKHETSGEEAGLVRKIRSSAFHMTLLSNFRDLQRKLS